MLALLSLLACVPADPGAAPLDTLWAMPDIRGASIACVELGSDGLVYYYAPGGEFAGSAVLEVLHPEAPWLAMEGRQEAILWSAWPEGDGWRLGFESDYHGRHEWAAEPCDG
jgi:hypothetical protein